MLNIVTGSHIWVEDKDLSRVDGEVFRIDGQNAHVRTTKGKAVCFALLLKSVTPLFSLFLVLHNFIVLFLAQSFSHNQCC